MKAVWACRQLARARHAFGGWSVGAVALVAGWLASTQPAGTRIAPVFPDGPHRYFDTVYNDDYCRRHNLLGAPPRPQPDTVDSSGDGVFQRWTQYETVTDPATVKVCR